MVCIACGRNRAALLDRRWAREPRRVGRPSCSRLGIAGSASLIIDPMDVLGVEGGRFEIKRGFFEIEPPRATARMGGGMATRKETDASRAAAPLPSLVPRFGSEESEHQLQRLIPLSSSLPKKITEIIGGPFCPSLPARV